MRLARCSVLLFALAGLGGASTGTLRAGPENLNVDVVIDFDRAGYRVAHPTSAAPAYYLPLVLGLTDFGDVAPFEPAPPPAAQVEHLLAVALFAQGYRVATTQFPPSLVLVFKWGVMSPKFNRRSQPMGSPNRGSLIQGGGSGGGPGGGAPSLNFGAASYNVLMAPESTQGESRQMLSLVFGDTLKDRKIEITPLPDAHTAQLLELARAPRIYLMVSAFDYADWMKHYEDWHEHKAVTPANRNPLLLWEAHISTELAGHTLEGAIPVLISTAAPRFGRETRTPQIIAATAVPTGRVKVGTPVMKQP